MTELNRVKNQNPSLSLSLSSESPSTAAAAPTSGVHGPESTNGNGVIVTSINKKYIPMDGFLLGDPSHQGMHEDGAYSNLDEAGSWYLSRKQIEENSPSKRDGIDLKKETYLRKSYCTFLQDLGMRLKVPPVTIATAIIFCHRFFLRHSHAINDRRTIATVCMFLAGKVEETPRPLRDVILVSYDIIHKKDPAAVHRIKQKEVYEQRKELILVGESLVLATLAFDLNVHHPYKPLVEAIKKFKVAQNALAQVAWNFVNDGLRTSLCLQFKPHHIAAGAIFLAAKFLKVKLPSDGERVWWQEFDVTPHQLEEVSNQMLELYEQNRVPPSHGSEVEGSAGGGASHQAPSKAPTANEEHVTSIPLKPGTSKLPASSRLVSDQPYGDTHSGVPRTTRSESDEHGNTEIKSYLNKADGKIQANKQLLHYQENKGESKNKLRSGSEEFGEDQERNVGKNETREAGRLNEKIPARNRELRETINQSPRVAIKKIDKDKVKAAREKQKKICGDTTRKRENMDEDDLIERELEDGIEPAAEREKIKRERRQSWPNNSNRLDEDSSYHGKQQGEAGDEFHREMKGQSCREPELENVEEGEVSALDDAGHRPRSPKSSHHKRKAESSPEKPSEGKQHHHDNMHRSHHNHHDYSEDQNRLGHLSYSERDHKRHLQENHA